MKVVIWSDFVCPFCYIGKRRFEQGLAQFSHRDQVEVIYKSFELNPQAARDGNGNVHDLLAAKYGMNHDQVTASLDGVTQMARTVGLTYHMDRTIQTNTFDAHRVAHFAASQGLLEAMTERLMKAHFTDGLHIGNQEQLATLAEEVGLDREEVIRMLTEGKLANEVRKEEQEAQQFGVNGVPFFLIDDTYYISGAQSSQVFTNALQKAWDDHHSQT
jgi:predicted DsbA family dithiol-disulfide isomerase